MHSACATTPQTIEEEVAPVVTRFAYEDGTTQYEYTSHRTLTQEVAGQTSQNQTSLRFLISTTIAQNNGTRTVQFSIDSIVDAAGPGFTPTMRRAVSGRTFDGSFAPTGKVQVPVEGERSSLLSAVNSAINEFFPLIPATGVETGSQWSDSTEISSDDGSTRITKMSTVYSTAGEWIDSVRTLPINWRAEYTLSGQGQQMGQDFTLSGTGVTEGQHMMSADGVYLGMSSRDSSSAEVTLPALGISVPIVQIGVDTVRVVR